MAIDVLRVHREDEVAPEGRGGLEQRVQGEERADEALALDGADEVDAQRRDDRRDGEQVQRTQRGERPVHQHAQPLRQRACDDEHGDGVDRLLFIRIEQVVAAHEQVHDDHDEDSEKNHDRVKI